jgi:hypothetical protein
LNGFIINKLCYTSLEALVEYGDKFFPLAGKTPPRPALPADESVTSESIPRPRDNVLDVEGRDRDAAVLAAIGAVQTPQAEVFSLTRAIKDAGVDIKEEGGKESVKAPIEVAPPVPSIDMVGLADLIESGVRIQMEDLRKTFDTQLGAAGAKHAGLLVALKQDFDGNMKAVIHTIGILTESIVGLRNQLAKATTEIQTLREQKNLATPDPKTIQATNLGQTIMNAKGAEVRLVIGDIKG